MISGYSKTGWYSLQKEREINLFISYFCIYWEQMCINTTVNTRTFYFWYLLYLFMTHLLCTIYFQHYTNRGDCKFIINLLEAWAVGNWVQKLWMGNLFIFCGWKYKKARLWRRTKSFIKLLGVQQHVTLEEIRVMRIRTTSQTMENICRNGVSYQISDSRI